MALVKDGWLMKISPRIIIIAVAVISLLGIISVAMTPSKMKAFSMSGVTKIYGSHGNDIYYRLGDKLIRSSTINQKDTEVVEPNLNDATLSPGGTKLVVRTMTKYKIQATLKDLDTGEERVYKDIFDTRWLSNNSLLIIRQAGGLYTISNETDRELYRNVPLGEIYTMGNSIFYRKGGDLAELETDTMELTNIDKAQTPQSIILTNIVSPVVSSGDYMTFTNTDKDFVTVSKFSQKKIGLEFEKGVYSNSSQEDQYAVVFTGSGSDNVLGIHKVNFSTGESSIVRNISNGKVAPVIKEDEPNVSTNATIIGNKLYFLLNGVIQELKV